MHKNRQLNRQLQNMSKNIFKLKTPKKTESLILVNYNIGINRLVASTRITIPTKLWNPKKNRLKIVADSYPIAEVNKKLDYIDDFVNMAAIKLKLENKLSRHYLAEEVLGLFNSKTKLNLFAWLDNYLIEIKNGTRLTASKRVFEVGSIKTFNSTILILKEYNSKLDWWQLDYAFCAKWLNWMTVVKGYKPSNIVRHFMRLKGLLKIAAMEEMPVNEAYAKWNVGSEKSSDLSIALTVEELAEMEGLKLVDSYDRTRDLFLIGVYTGMRFSDYSTIDYNAVVDGYLTVIQQKTKGKVVIPVGHKLSKIFNKYGGVPEVITNQKFNKGIKKVAGLCDLLKKGELLSYTKAGKHVEETKQRADLVSSHTARRTFATLAYERGTPTQAIMAITGHKTEKSFLAYIKTSKEKQAEIFKQYEK